MQIDSKDLYKAIENSLESQQFKPLYFFFGDEPYLIQKATEYLKVCALHGGAADFNFSSYYSGDVEVQTVCDEVETLPMMSSRRVVILKEVQDLTDKEWVRLESLFELPVESTAFILVGGKVDKRKKAIKTLIDRAISVEFKKPYENQIPGWISHIAKGLGLEISNEATQLLHRLVGNQLNELESELIKLKDFLGGRTQVELEDVASCVSKKREENVFDLCDSLGNGDKILALEQLVHLLDQGQNEIGIVSLVARHIRLLMQIKLGIEEEGLSGQRLAAFAQVPSYYLQDYVKQSQAWNFKRLESALLILGETDKALKSSPLSSHIWLENMVLKMCAVKAPILNNTRNWSSTFISQASDKI